VWFHYSANRKGKHPLNHLKDFQGILQADALAGYRLFDDGNIIKAACWSHARRKCYNILEREHRLSGPSDTRGVTGPHCKHGYMPTSA